MINIDEWIAFSKSNKTGRNACSNLDKAGRNVPTDVPTY